MQAANREWCRTVALGAVMLASAATVAAAVEPRIVNGIPTQAEAATGALLAHSGNALRASCSGVLIGCRTFLTAAHCVCPGDSFCVPDPGGFSVFLQHGGVFEAEAVAVHPQYAFGLRSDVAVVRLAVPVSGIAPASINFGGTPDYGTPGSIVGFGRSRASVDDAGLKRRGQVVVSSCADASFPVPEPAHVCWKFASPFGTEGENSNTCFGDSGGPLFIESPDTGAGTVVAGIASGGASGSCLPPDVAFNANVYENRAFIELAAFGDLGQTACGSLPLVGSAATTVVPAGSAVLTKTSTGCRKEVGKQLSQHTAATFKAWQACLDGVASGRRSGPCPDATTLLALEKATGKVDLGKLERRCPGAIAAASLLGGACADAEDVTALHDCALGTGDAAALAWIQAAYADPVIVDPLPKELARCQKAIGKGVGKYAQARVKAFASCRAKADRGRAAECPDARTAGKLDKAAVVLARGISRGCDAAQIAALAPGTGGMTAPCFANSDVEALAACLTEAVVTAAEPVLATIQDVQTGPRVRFEVPAGTLSLRLTLNGVDRASGTPNDLDLYVRFATEPSVLEFDAAGTRQGVFEAIEIPGPAAGFWHAFVAEVSGKRLPYQLTVTAFGP